MSNKAKIIIRIICLIVLAITTVLLVKHYNKVQEQEKHKKLMHETIQEIERIHNNSYLLGLQLLDLPPDDFKLPLGNDVFVEGEKVGYYNCQEFDGKLCITQIVLKADKGNILGMKVGDQYDKTSTFLESEGYILSDEVEGVPSDRKAYIFEKAYVTIGIQVFPDNVIEYIWVAISDPTMPVLVF